MRLPGKSHFSRDHCSQSLVMRSGVQDVAGSQAVCNCLPGTALCVHYVVFSGVEGLLCATSCFWPGGQRPGQGAADRNLETVVVCSITRGTLLETRRQKCHVLPYSTLGHSASHPRFTASRIHSEANCPLTWVTAPIVRLLLTFLQTPCK